MKPWDVDPQVYQTKTPPQASTYVLSEGGPGDYQKGKALYQPSVQDNFFSPSSLFTVSTT